jgi:hypothetical protein
LAGVPAESCTEETATEVLSKHVENELGCVSGWQDVIARSAQAQDVGRQAYVRTVCRKSRQAE